jgi:hypothetical protein
VLFRSEAADCFDRAGATLDAKVLADLNRFRAEGKDLAYKVDADDPDALVQDLAKLFNKFAGDYMAFDVEGFRARLPRRAKSWLEPWARELLSTVWTELKKRYGEAPEAPVIVVFCEKPEEAVCLSYGVPGSSGCLGKVIVLPVPNGEFSWAAAVWRGACQSFLLHRAGSKTPPDWLFEGVGEYCVARGFDRSRDLSLMLGRRDGRIQRLADAPAEAVQYLAEKNGWTGIDRFENADAPFLEWLDAKLAKIRYLVPPKPDDPRIAGADKDPKDAGKSVEIGRASCRERVS